MIGRYVLLLAVLLAGCRAGVAVQNNQGNTLAKQEQLGQAVRAYELAMVTDPEHPVPYYNAGLTYIERGDLARAEAALEQALRAAPTELRPDIQFALGEVYFQQARYQEAIEAFRNVLLARPDDNDARYNLELALFLLPTDTPSPTPTQTSTDERQDATSTATSTPTPTPDESNPDEEQTPTPQPDQQEEATQTPGPQTPQPPNELDREQALQILDQVQEGQGAIESQFSDEMGTSGIQEKDW